MKVIFLGVGEAFDENYANNSCLIQSERTVLMIDCGDSAVRNLWKYTGNHSFVDALYISHRHSDHLFGLPAFLSRMLEEKREKELTIISTKEIIEDIKVITKYAYQGLESNFLFKINFIEIKACDEINFKDLSLKFALSNHSVPNLAVKVSDGKSSIGYSGDGIISDDHFSMYKDLDLLIHESYTYDKDIKGHVKIKDLISLSKKNNVKCLALVHMQRDFRKNSFESCRESICSQFNIIIPAVFDEVDV